jgi:hypothetical protein
LFSLECLIDMAAAADMEPQVTFKKPRTARKARDTAPAAA